MLNKTQKRNNNKVDLRKRKALKLAGFAGLGGLLGLLAGKLAFASPAEFGHDASEIISGTLSLDRLPSQAKILGCVAYEDYPDDSTDSTTYVSRGYFYIFKTEHIDFNKIIFVTRCKSITAGQTLTAGVFLDDSTTPSLELTFTSNGEIKSGVIDVSSWTKPSRHKVEVKYKVSGGIGYFDLREFWVQS
jgi:hypothetical protein